MQLLRTIFRTLLGESTIRSIVVSLKRIKGLALFVSIIILSAPSCEIDEYPYYIEGVIMRAGVDCSTPVGLYDSCQGNCTCGVATRTPEVTTNSVINECAWTDPATISGTTVTSGGNSATLSGDGTTLVWTTGANWVRSCK
jgi:hypothetical protein